MNYERIIIFAPHTDDGELDCGGTISKLCKLSKEVYYVAFSTCRRSLPIGIPEDTLEKEVKEATKILGIKPENLILFDFDVRSFHQFRQEILDEMLKLKAKIQPDLIIVPSQLDMHQDHQTISNEGIRAFKDISIWGYEMPWNNLSFNTQCFVKLEKENMEDKMKALRAYKSQEYRKYLNKDFIYGLATTRGVQVNCSYAEAFEIVRQVI